MFTLRVGFVCGTEIVRQRRTLSGRDGSDRRMDTDGMVVAGLELPDGSIERIWGQSSLINIEWIHRCVDF